MSKPASVNSLETFRASSAQFTTRFADMPPPALLANVGWLGIRQMLHSGGAGFFPCRMTRDLIESGRLWVVADSPVFSLPVYLVYPLERADSALQTALRGLRQLGEQERRQRLSGSGDG